MVDFAGGSVVVPDEQVLQDFHVLLSLHQDLVGFGTHFLLVLWVNYMNSYVHSRNLTFYFLF